MIIKCKFKVFIKRLCLVKLFFLNFVFYVFNMIFYMVGIYLFFFKRKRIFELN